MAKATIVSTLPMGLEEKLYGVFPPYYNIPPAPKGGISVLHVDDGFHLYLIPAADDKMPPMKIVDPGERIAESIISDFTKACVGVGSESRPDGSIAKPGLFWVQGEVSAYNIKKDFPEQVAKAKANTMAWFENLVKLADDEWQRTRQYKMILDLSKHACNYLNLNREWNFDVMKVTNERCWACQSIVDSKAIICQSCKAILNQEQYAKMSGSFAKG